MYGYFEYLSANRDYRVYYLLDIFRTRARAAFLKIGPAISLGYFPVLSEK